MSELLQLPLTVQLMLVGGYFGYAIATIGRGLRHRADETILQVLAFGACGILATDAYVSFCPAAPGWTQTLALPLLAMLAGVAWRVKGYRWASWTMGALGVYRDDHEASVWHSIGQAPAKWTFAFLHLKDGSVLEAEFHDQPPFPRPLADLMMNEDGIALYVTAVHRANGKRIAKPDWPEAGAMISYVPRTEIVRLEMCGHPSKRNSNVARVRALARN